MILNKTAPLAHESCLVNIQGFCELAKLLSLQSAAIGAFIVWKLAMTNQGFHKHTLLHTLHPHTQTSTLPSRELVYQPATVHTPVLRNEGRGHIYST